MVGVLSGTYSSIFIATPVLIAWKEREPAYQSRGRADRRADGLRARVPGGQRGRPRRRGARAGAAKAAKRRRWRQRPSRGRGGRRRRHRSRPPRSTRATAPSPPTTGARCRDDRARAPPRRPPPAPGSRSASTEGIADGTCSSGSPSAWRSGTSPSSSPTSSSAGSSAPSSPRSSERWSAARSGRSPRATALGETDVSTFLAAIPGCLIALAIVYLIGSRDPSRHPLHYGETPERPDERANRGFARRFRPRTVQA